MTRLPEASAVVNEADSVNAQLAVASTDEKVISKPQVVSTALKSVKDLQSYVTVAGDTVSNLASKFGVSSDTIKWSNDLTSDSLPAGKELWISPVNGIVYVVKANDTAESLATKYKANKDQIIAFNDAEVSGLPIGKRIVIPDGTIATTRSTASYTSYAYGFTPTYGFNGYDPGWCTWYVASRIAIPTNWGNANTWDNYAALSGWIVSKTPVPGAIGQTDAGWAGHVAVVEAVSEDGTMIKYSDMNGLAGFNHVGYSDWVSISKFQNYIYH
jgi:surface antigen